MPRTGVQSHVHHRPPADDPAVQPCENLPRTAFNDDPRVTGNQGFHQCRPANRFRQFSHQTGSNVFRRVQRTIAAAADESDGRTVQRNLLQGRRQNVLGRLHEPAVIGHRHPDRAAREPAFLQLSTQPLQIRNQAGNDRLVRSVVTGDVAWKLQPFQKLRHPLRICGGRQHGGSGHPGPQNRTGPMQRGFQSTPQIPGSGCNQSRKLTITVPGNEIRPHTGFLQSLPGSQIGQQNGQLRVEHVIAQPGGFVLSQKLE